MVKTADIDNQRLTWFLMGTVLTLSILFTALEYTSTYSDADIDEDLLEDMSADIEPYPMVETNTVAMTTVAAKSDAKTEDIIRVKSVDEGRDNTASQSNVDGDDEGIVSNTNVQGTYVAGSNDNIIGKDNLVDTNKDKNKVLDFRVVQQIPEFPGGMGAFVQWLTANLQYPISAQRRKVEGKVVVTFIVNEDGSTSNIKIAKSVDMMLDREVLRVVRMMPKWKPGIENDKPCRTMMAIPVNFQQ